MQQHVHTHIFLRTIIIHSQGNMVIKHTVYLSSTIYSYHKIHMVHFGEKWGEIIHVIGSSLMKDSQMKVHVHE